MPYLVVVQLALLPVLLAPRRHGPKLEDARYRDALSADRLVPAQRIAVQQELNRRRGRPNVLGGAGQDGIDSVGLRMDGEGVADPEKHLLSILTGKTGSLKISSFHSIFTMNCPRKELKSSISSSEISSTSSSSSPPASVVAMRLWSARSLFCFSKFACRSALVIRGFLQ